jgi:hypothetical protein
MQAIVRDIFNGDDTMSCILSYYYIIECRTNLKPDGTCAEGALAPDCCECDTTGNATHAFYKNENDECIRKYFNRL